MVTENQTTFTNNKRNSLENIVVVEEQVKPIQIIICYANIYRKDLRHFDIEPRVQTS